MNGCLEASQEVMSLSGREAQAQPCVVGIHHGLGADAE